MSSDVSYSSARSLMQQIAARTMSSGRPGRLRAFMGKPPVLVVFCVVVTWFLLGLLQVTTSHMGVFSGQPEEVVTTLIGEPRNVRSDEFLRNSPLVLSSLNSSDSSWSTPLELANNQKFRPSGLERAVEVATSTPDNLTSGFLRSFLPIPGQFAIIWWSSSALFFCAFVLWIRELGGERWIGAIGGVALFCMPLNQWFSYLPTLLLGNAVASAFLVLLSLRLLPRPAPSRRRAIAKWALLLLSFWWALSYAYTCLRYPPWGIPIALVILAVSLPELAARFAALPARRSCPFAAALLALAGVFVIRQLSQQGELIDAILATEYPGQRRSTGADADSPEFLGGAVSWMMQMTSRRNTASVNPEMAFAPAVLLMVPVLSLLSRRSDGERTVARRILAVALGTGVVGLIGIWGSSAVPAILTRWNPLTLVPAGRGLQIFGYLAVVLAVLSMLIPGVRKNRGRCQTAAEAMVVGVVVYLFAIRSTDRLRLDFYGDTRRWVSVASVSAVVAVALALMYSSRNRWLGLSALAVFSVMSSVLVNPVITGIGPLDDSDALRAVREISRDEPTGRWATTGFFEDALMVASGVPQLTGQQHSAPDFQAWRTIDPQEQFVSAWNRGQSYVNIQFDPGFDFSIWNPSPDVIQVVASPCDTRFEALSLRFIASVRPVSSDCAELITTVQWMSAPLYIYRYSPIPYQAG